MQSRDRPKFIEFLVEAGANVPKSVCREESPKAAIIPIRTADALSLSVQGKKAIVPRKDRNGEECSGEYSEVDEGIKSTDWQGNKVHLSSNGRGMAQDMEERVAWETKLERKKTK